MQITIETKVQARLADVWRAWNTPSAITEWNAASDDWQCPRAEVDLRVGGTFTSRMEARDGSMGFDFSGTYTNVTPHELIEYTMEDGRTVSVTFFQGDGVVTVRETFDAEDEHSGEQQRQGWQAILDRFKDYVEQR